MSIIRALAPEVANRIAAGEVIERPASVVKELVENALDAGAGRIRVQTSHGGQRLVQVTDDGCGMDRDDALMCLEAHATSKIRDLVDVGQIQTLGFRGEAVPSIASVSHFLLQTRQAESPVGTEVLVEAGVLREVRDCGCAPGTNVRVTHLFGNLPARRKFLRSPDTEDGHIHEVILLQALAHPGVAFEYLADQREAVRVAASGDLAARLGMLMGREVLAEMLAVDYQEAGIRVHGFTGKPGLSRSSRKEQRIIVNGRPASAETVYFAIKDAYSSLVLKERYAPVVLYLELPPDLVDVNVHPAKREVRFREARLVGQVVSAAVGRALRGMVSLDTATAADAAAGAALAAGPVVPPAARPFRLSPGPQQLRLPVRDLPPVPPPPAAEPAPPAAEPAPPSRPAVPSLSGAGARPPAAASAPLPAASPAAPVSSSVPVPSSSSSGGGREDLAGLRILGMLRETYVVAAGPRGLVLIDPVAAQQRVLFEYLLKNAAATEVLRQQLLIPVTLDVGLDDARRLRQCLGDLGKLGFSIEPFGGNTFLVTAVPARFPPDDLSGLLRDILDEVSEHGRLAPDSADVRLARAAVRHAALSRRPMNDRELAQLLQELARTEMPYTDPSGAPVMVHLPHAEIERRFGRRNGA